MTSEITDTVREPSYRAAGVVAATIEEHFAHHIAAAISRGEDGVAPVPDRAAIKQMLEKDYYYTATVRVSIDQASSAPVKLGAILISGAKNNVLRAQGQQMLVAGEPLTLTTAVLKSMPTEWADLKKVQITRVKKDGSIEKIIVDVKKIIETGDAKSDPVLQDGDRILVPDKWGVF